MINLYKNYNNIVTLDITFSLNRFNMPLFTMTGVKNNGKTVVFGFAFLKDEIYDVKKWAFQSFLAITNDINDIPEALISDGCSAFPKAIYEIFPTKTLFTGMADPTNLKMHFSGLKKA